MVEASCSATRRSRSSASSAPCSGSPRLKALRRESWVWRRWSTPERSVPNHLAVVGDAADRGAAEIDAVIAALAADQPRLRGVALHPVIGERDLERGLDRLGARVGEEHVVEAWRRDVDELRGAFEGARMAHLEGAGEIELADLLADRLDDLRPAMSGIDAPQTRGAVEHLASIVGGEVHALGADEQARRPLILPVRRERHPECFEVVGREFRAHVSGS